MKLLVIGVLIQLASAILRNCSDNFNEVAICTTDSEYNKMLPAKNDTPLLLVTSVTFYNIDRVEENEQTITFNVLIAVGWNDSRLLLKNGNGSRVIGPEIALDVFNPRLKIKNTKVVKNIELVGSGHSDVTFIFGYDGRLYLDHYLEYQQSLKVTLYCPFAFNEYPLDKNECKFQFGPASHFVNSVIMRATFIRYQNESIRVGDGPLKMQKARLPYEFQLEILDPFVYQEAGFEYSYAGVNIKMRRYEYHTLLIGFYFPTLIFALLSYISFFISPEMVSLKNSSSF